MQADDMNVLQRNKNSLDTHSDVLNDLDPCSSRNRDYNFNKISHAYLCS